MPRRVIFEHRSWSLGELNGCQICPSEPAVLQLRCIHIATAYPFAFSKLLISLNTQSIAVSQCCHIGGLLALRDTRQVIPSNSSVWFRISDSIEILPVRSITVQAFGKLLNPVRNQWVAESTTGMPKKHQRKTEREREREPVEGQWKASERPTLLNPRDWTVQPEEEIYLRIHEQRLPATEHYDFLINDPAERFNQSFLFKTL